MNTAQNSPPPSRPAVVGEGITWLSRWTFRWIVLVVGAVVLGWVVQQTWSVLLPILLALILTTVLQPSLLWLERRWHLPPAAAALSVIAGALGVIALVILFITPSVGSQVTEIADSASGGLSEVERWVQNSRLDISHDQLDAFINAAQDRLRSSATSIASGVLVGVSAVTSALITLVLTLVLSFLFLKDGRRFLPWVRELSGPEVGRHLSEVGSRSWDTLADIPC